MRMKIKLPSEKVSKVLSIIMITILVSNFIAPSIVTASAIPQRSSLKCHYTLSGKPVIVTFYDDPPRTHCPPQRVVPQGPDGNGSTHFRSRDPQLGYSTTYTYGATGVNDHETAVSGILNDDIGIGNGFTDEQDNWWHIGIGDNTEPDSGCDDPPVIWGEYIPSGSSAGWIPLVCATYGNTYQLSIVYDTYIWEFAFFVNGTERASVWFEDQGAYVGEYGNTEFLEKSSSPSCPSSTYTPITTAFQYSTSPAYNGNIPSFHNDVPRNSINLYNETGGGSFGSCWDIDISSSPSYTITYQ
jgi:hypothetical protein